MLYNKADTAIYKLAVRIKTNADAILRDLEASVSVSPTPSKMPVPGEVMMQDSASSRHEEANKQVVGSPAIGNLEPAMRMLDLLVEKSNELDIPYILDVPPIDSLFSQEFGIIKPPPPPPPRPLLKIKLSAVQKKPSRGSRRRKDRNAVSDSPQQPTPGSSFTEATTDSTRDSPSTHTHPTPTSSQAPAVVETVDSHESFKRFEQGWILPPDVKRGGRTPIDRSALPPPPPRKRQRTGICAVNRLKDVTQIFVEKSRLSSFSTPTAENQTLQISDSSDIAASQSLQNLSLPNDAISRSAAQVKSSSPVSIVASPSNIADVTLQKTHRITKNIVKPTTSDENCNENFNAQSCGS